MSRTNNVKCWKLSLFSLELTHVARLLPPFSLMDAHSFERCYPIMNSQEATGTTGSSDHKVY